MTVNITNVHVTDHGVMRPDSGMQQFSLGWDTADGRYHVWLDKPGVPRQVVYKNPLRDIERGQPGHFDTRRLQLKTMVNTRMVGEALRIAREADLYTAATKAREKAEADALAKRRAEAEAEDRTEFAAILTRFVERGRLAQDAADRILAEVNQAPFWWPSR
jgi:hypothetical protein